MTVQNINPHGELNTVSVQHVGQMQSSSLPHHCIIRFNCAKDAGKGLEKKDVEKYFSRKTVLFLFFFFF